MPRKSESKNESDSITHTLKDDKSRLTRAPYKTNPDFQRDYHGQCFCGAIQFELHGEPKQNVFCHCRSCQRLHGAPSTLTSIYDKECVQFTKGAADDMVFYSPQEKKTEYKVPLKISCKQCHSPVGNEGNSMMLILPSLIDFSETQHTHGRLPECFKPTFHQYYETRIRDIEDDLPKFEGKKNEKPLNGAAEQKMKEDAEKKEKKEKEEKSKEPQNGQEKETKKQKKK